MRFTYADRKWAKAVKERAEGLCQVCGAPGDEAHHLAEKGSTRFRHLRHDLRGGMYLCKKDHDKAHLDRVEFRRWAAEDLKLDYFIPLYEEMKARGWA